MALNIVLRRKLPQDMFERLEGRKVGMTSQTSNRDELSHSRRALRSLRDNALPDVQFRASAYDFASLAAREQDADTLFFNRRLMVEATPSLRCW